MLDGIRPLRIALVTFEYPPFVYGGAGTWAEHISNELVSLGHEVHVFSAKGSNAPSPIQGITIHTVPIGKIKILHIPLFWIGSFLLFLLMGRQRKRFDCIIDNGFSGLFIIKKLCDATRITVIHQSSKELINILRPSSVLRLRKIDSEIGAAPVVDTILMRRADGIMVVSNHVKEYMVREHAVREEDVKVIYNGINDCYIPMSEVERMDFKSTLGTGKLILFVGRPSDVRKGFVTLLASMPFVLEQLEATLLVVGSGNIPHLRAQAKALGIDSHVSFLGKVDNDTLYRLYSACDLFVSTSRYESFGLTLLEALTALCPIVACDVSAIREITAGTHATLVPCGSVPDLTNAIIDILKNPPSDEKSIRDREHVLNTYTWKRTAIQLESYIMSLGR